MARNKDEHRIIYITDARPDDISVSLCQMEKYLNEGYYINNVWQTEHTIIFYLEKNG